MHRVLLVGLSAKYVLSRTVIDSLRLYSSLNPRASKSKTLTFSASTIRLQFIAGTRTGLATRTKLSRNMVTDGIGSGSSSLHTAPSPAGLLKQCFLGCHAETLLFQARECLGLSDYSP